MTANQFITGVKLLISHVRPSSELTSLFGHGSLVWRSPHFGYQELQIKRAESFSKVFLSVWISACSQFYSLQKTMDWWYLCSFAWALLILSEYRLDGCIYLNLYRLNTKQWLAPLMQFLMVWLPSFQLLYFGTARNGKESWSSDTSFNWLHLLASGSSLNHLGYLQSWIDFRNAKKV